MWQPGFDPTISACAPQPTYPENRLLCTEAPLAISIHSVSWHMLPSLAAWRLVGVHEEGVYNSEAVIIVTKAPVSPQTKALPSLILF